MISTTLFPTKCLHEDGVAAWRENGYKCYKLILSELVCLNLKCLIMRGNHLCFLRNTSCKLGFACFYTRNFLIVLASRNIFSDCFAIILE